ncbi:hypothetical protein PG987_011132 [Apiospora arundinis]
MLDDDTPITPTMEESDLETEITPLVEGSDSQAEMTLSTESPKSRDATTLSVEDSDVKGSDSDSDSDYDFEVKTTVQRRDIWWVSTQKEAAEGTRFKPIIEFVPELHELLPQSLAPTFIRGDPEDPECIISTFLYRTWHGETYHLEKKTEFASPECEVLSQRELAQYKATASPPGELLAQCCGALVQQVKPPVVLYLENVREDAEALYDLVSIMVTPLYAFVVATLLRHWRKFLAAIVVLAVLFLTCLHAAWTAPDAILDRSTAINHEIAGILRNASLRELQPLRLGVSAYQSGQAMDALLKSGLDRPLLAPNLVNARKLTNSLAGRIDEFSLKLSITGMELHHGYDSALFDLSRRDELPSSGWHKRLMNITLPTLKEVRQGLIDETHMLGSRLDSLIGDAAQMRKDIAGVARELEAATEKASRHKSAFQAELHSLLNQTSWAGWMMDSTRDRRAQVLQRDLEAADTILEYARDGRALIDVIPVHEVQEDLAAARGLLRALGEPMPSLKLKVYFYFLMAGITPEQEVGIKRVHNFTSFFDARPSYRLPK